MRWISYVFTFLAICGLAASVTLESLVTFGVIPIWRATFVSQTVAYWAVICACLAVVFQNRVNAMTAQAEEAEARVREALSSVGDVRTPGETKGPTDTVARASTP